MPGHELAESRLWQEPKSVSVQDGNGPRNELVGCEAARAKKRRNNCDTHLGIRVPGH
jgi:hypothetical protein